MFDEPMAIDVHTDWVTELHSHAADLDDSTQFLGRFVSYADLGFSFELEWESVTLSTSKPGIACWMYRRALADLDFDSFSDIGKCVALGDTVLLDPKATSEAYNVLLSQHVNEFIRLLKEKDLVLLSRLKTALDNLCSKYLQCS